MRVLQINTVCGTGSTGRIALDIHKLLLENGYESYIAYGRGKRLGSREFIKIGNTFSNYSHGLKTRIFDNHGFGSRKATLELVRRIKELNPDVIHLHNIHGYYLNIEVLFSFLRDYNKPVVWTLHDCWAFTGHCACFDFANCEQWRTHCTKCPEKKSYPKSFAFDNSYRNFDQKKKIFSRIRGLSIVTPSGWLSDLVGESFLSNYPRRLINNGIDLEVFKPTKGDFRNTRDLDSLFIILGVASVWNRRKGLDTFVTLSRKLNNDEKIVLVGLTKKQIESLPSHIIGIERTNNTKELAEIYTAADVFVNPTLEDNLPTTNLEAMACGTPVITFRTGGSPETLGDRCGIVIEKEDTESLRRALEIVKLRGKEVYSKHCRNWVLRKFEARGNFRQYLNLYNEIQKV